MNYDKAMNMDKVEFGETSGAVDKMNVDGGRATAALKLENGKTSARFISNSGDGYYYVTLIDKTESTVNYKSIFVPFSELKNRIEEARKNGKIEEIRKIASISSEELSVYRNRLIKKGVVRSEQHGHLSFTLPRFKEYILNK